MSHISPEATSGSSTPNSKGSNESTVSSLMHFVVDISVRTSTPATSSTSSLGPVSAALRDKELRALEEALLINPLPRIDLEDDVHSLPDSSSVDGSDLSTSEQSTTAPQPTTETLQVGTPNAAVSRQTSLHPGVQALREARSSEIQTATTQRRVSAMSEAFRQRLESIVEGTPARLASLAPLRAHLLASGATVATNGTAAPVATTSTTPASQLQSQRNTLPTRPAQRAPVAQVVNNSTIEVELGELVEHHTVTSLLSSEFRNRLERLIRRRLQSAGVAPPIYIQRRQTDHQRQVEEIDAAVAANARAHGGHSSRELDLIRQEMLELRRMMCASLEMQMEMQRTLRQEVSAVLMAQRQSPAPATFAPAANPPPKADTCIVCCEKSVDCAFYKCGHMCACHMCGLSMQQRSLPCPVCRAPIREVLRVYHTS
eukprot:TRINITY_DN6575_c0_g1_i1.p1 TRINITY_DN6575_c0_g1~~TRINITY_DN6575_c0_g1_i1.p1  ORF type:complete len:429 (+),score=91.11 TRINITY_DN6575_c0_g1_i1:197-1483(+)